MDLCVACSAPPELHAGALHLGAFASILPLIILGNPMKCGMNRKGIERKVNSECLSEP